MKGKRAMNWLVATLISSALFLVGSIASIFSSAKRKITKYWLSPSKIMFITIILSAIVWFFPYSIIKTDNSFLAFEASLQYAITLFAVNDGFFELIGDLNKFESIDIGSFSYIERALNIPWDTIFYVWYAGLGGVLFIGAPVLTFHFILTFFKNLAAYLRYLVSPKKNVHIFSELNEKSLALAKSINTKEYRRANRGRPVIIFADIVDKNEEEHLDLVAEARQNGAILFRKDICSIYFPRRGRKRFYLISDNEAEKTRHATHIIQHYKKRKNTYLYVFSDSMESKCLLDSYTSKERINMTLKVIRVNDIRSLIYHNLGCNGLRLFKNATPMPDGTREISALVVGLGKYGLEMLKALLWYCQFPGYTIRITAIDESKHAKTRFSAACREISLKTHKLDANDMKYYVDVKRARAGTEEFRKIISDLVEQNASPTYVFVCLGSDATNISTALDIRCQLAGLGKFPDIETVVYDTALKNRVNMEWDKHTGDKNDMQRYDIHVIGDLDSFYSYNTVINSDLTNQGYKVHARWDNKKSKNPENNFYMNDYNFFSSLAGTLHRDLRSRVAELSGEERSFFPAIFSESTEDANTWTTPASLLDAIRKTKEIDDLDKLSEKMYYLSDRLYSKLAEIHYTKLSDDDKIAVLQSIRTEIDKENASLPAPKKRKKEPPLPINTRLLNQLDADADHLAGINEMLQAYFAVESDVKARKKHKKCPCDIIKDWDTIKAERDFIKNMFRHVVETQYAKQPAGTDKIAFKLGFEFEALSEQEKQEVRSFIKAFNTYDLDECITMSHSFAYIEHIRWNAYMRTEGYSFCTNYTSSLRKYNLHGNLVPVDQLTFIERIKDI